MELPDSLLCFQEPTVGPYTDTDESSAHLIIPVSLRSRKKYGKTSDAMEGLSSRIFITGLPRPNTVKDDDADVKKLHLRCLPQRIAVDHLCCSHIYV
jgi:hypothetical protein